MTDPMAALKARFLERLVEDLAAFRGAEPRIVGPLAHRLAGSAGLFGYAELGRLARIVDDEWREGEIDPDALQALIAEGEGVLGGG